MPKIAIIANTKSRNGAGWATFEPLVRQRPHMRVLVLGKRPLDELVQQAMAEGCETIAAAGGDGTLSSVADAVARRGGAKFGVLPAGTLNHFAKDCGIPLEPARALDVLEQGHTALIDLGCVNGRYFLNNSSIGFYPAVIKARRALESRGINGWLAFFYAIAVLGIRRPAFSVSFSKESSLAPKVTSSIFIGNNRYMFSGLTIGARARLDEGLLFVAIIKRMGPRRAWRAALKIAADSASAAEDINTAGLAECTIESKRKSMRVSIDGELCTLAAPLKYSIAPKALRVIIPRP